MPERLYRTRILLEPEQQRVLAEIARREGRSDSDLVREMIRAQLAQRSQAEEAVRARQLPALDQIRQHGEALRERHGGPLEIDIVALLDELREERDAHNLVPDDRD